MDEVVNLLAKRFIQRSDVKAIQHDNGAWTPKREKFTRSDLESHVAGKHTLGHYLVDQEDKCKLFIFDIDLVKEEQELEDLDGNTHTVNPREVWQDRQHPLAFMLNHNLRCMAEGLAIRAYRLFQFPTAISFSGHKGLHVYIFTGVVKAAAAREAALAVLESYGCFEPVRGRSQFRHSDGFYPMLNIEIYPKQDSLENKDLGNLVSLPLGIHRKTKNRKFFLTDKVPYGVFQEIDPEIALREGLTWPKDL